MSAAARRGARAVLEVSPAAAARLRELVARAPPPRPAGVRVGLRTRGCNGMSYVLDYAAAAGPFDERVRLPPVEGGNGDAGELEVFVDPRALLHIVGTRMDFVDNDLVREFRFDNPQAASHCGCGESFSTKPAANAG
jgi:iron-sulfur cluster assembly 1